MNKSIIRFILCRVMQFEGIFLLLPCMVSLFYKERQGLVFLVLAVTVFALGTLGALIKPKSNVFYAREGFVTVSLSWIVLSLIGALPFVLTNEIPNYVDAFFETVSGFTTTGGSILTDVEAMSQTTMFWRCFTNWIGGMGVLVFIMAILPLSGSYNMHLMRAESTGAEVGKLVPKVKDTAKMLYLIYFGLTVILVVLFLCTGMSLYDSLIIAFSNMGTGGFANLNASLGGYSHAAQVIATVFMILCAVNFNVYFLILQKRPKDILKLEEVKWFLVILAISIGVITWQVRDCYGSLYEAFHQAAFQVASIVSTTGFSTTDFDKWPMLSKGILLLLMVTGGCAGSTCGGIKVSRVILAMRTLKRELSHLTHPRSVKKIQYNGSPVGEDTVKSVGSFMIAYVLILIVSVLLVSIDGFDFESTFTAVLASLGNIGPGLGMVGPTGNFSEFSAFSKLVLSFDMLAGRLELFPLLVLGYVGTWKRN